MKYIKAIFDLLKDTFFEWRDDKASRLAAALAYYAVLSLPPLLIVVLAVVGLTWGARTDAQAQIMAQVEDVVGSDGAQLVETMIEGASDRGSGIVATVVGVVTLLFGAMGVFAQLQGALNTIWEVEVAPDQGIWSLVRTRFLSFGMVLGIGFLLVISLLVSALLTVLETYLNELFPNWSLLQYLNFFISLGVITLLFAIIFKVLPDVKIAWRDVWMGALVTAVLFTVGKFLLGWYLGRAGVASTYGAAGSLVVILLWIYYSAQIFFFGAEFTQVYSRRYGSRILPSDAAVRAPEARQTVQKRLRQKAAQAAATKEQQWATQPAASSSRTRSRTEKDSIFRDANYYVGLLALMVGVVIGVLYRPSR